MRKYLRRLTRTWLGDREARQLHAASNAKARAAYESIVAQDPERTLNAATKKRIAQYSKDVFGSQLFAPWLEVYAAYRGQFLEGWIPGNYLSKVLVPSWTRYSRIDAKNLARRVLGTDRIPDLAYHFNGSWIDRDHQHIPPADLKARIFSDHDAVFVKLNRSSRGRGVWKIDRSDFDAEKLAALGDFVIQSPIQQHPFFDRFSADSVATLRITTVKQRGLRAVKKASYLRLGRSGAQHIRSDAQFRIPIVDDLGTLGPRGADASWASFSAHPDSNEEFSGQLVPGFESAVQLCETLHDQTPVTILIGWDIAIDPAGMPVLMEWNQGAAATKFSEASVGPCFRNLGWEDIWRSQ